MKKEIPSSAPGARLIRSKEKVCTGRELAFVLLSADIADAEAKAWNRELCNARKQLNRRRP